MPDVATEQKMAQGQIGAKAQKGNEPKPGFKQLMIDAYENEIPLKEGKYDQCYFDFCDKISAAVLA